MKVNLPNKFSVLYPVENKKYYKLPQLIKKSLLQESHNYCMYCGKLMVVEGDDYSQMEHSVDKMGNYNQSDEETFLTHCKYNFAVACPKCNMSYKKKVVKSDIRPYTGKQCIGVNCSSPCSDYMDLHAKYCENNHIILQPLGHIKNEMELGITYNVFQHFYEPNVEPDTKAFFMVEDHIDRFKLNNQRISLSIIEICEEIVRLYDKGIRDFASIIEIIEGRTYLNIIGEQFVLTIKDTFLASTADADDLISFFKILVILSEVY